MLSASASLASSIAQIDGIPLALPLLCSSLSSEELGESNNLSFASMKGIDNDDTTVTFFLDSGA